MFACNETLNATAKRWLYIVSRITRHRHAPSLCPFRFVVLVVAVLVVVVVIARSTTTATGHIGRIRFHFRISPGDSGERIQRSSSARSPYNRGCSCSYPTTPYCTNPSARWRSDCQFPWQITFQYHVPPSSPSEGGGRSACRPLRTPARIVRG